MEAPQTQETTEEVPVQPVVEIARAVGYVSVVSDDYEWDEDVAYGD